MKRIVTLLQANNDPSGVPRRLWIVKDLVHGRTIAVYQELSGDRPDAVMGPGYYDHGSYVIRIAEYFKIKSHAKDLGQE